MKPTFLKYFIFPVFFLLVFQGEGRGEVFSGFGKEVGEETAACVKEHSNEALFLLIKNADNDAARIRYSHAWNYLDLAESSSKLDPTVLTKLGDDLLDANFATFLEGGVGRVKAWEEALIRNLPESLRRNPDFIEPFAKALDEKPKIDLHLTGHINGSGNAVGCHIASAIDGVNIRLRNPQPSGLPTYYPDGKLKNAAVDIKDISGNWVSKNANSTFFPDSWTYDKVLEEIAYVRSIGSNKITDRIWKGKGSDGITEIQVEYTGVLDNLTFSTVYPVIN